MSAAPASPPYAVRLEVEYPTAPRNRLTVALRLFAIIPILVLLSMLSGGGNGTRVNDDRIDGVERDGGFQRSVGVVGTGIVVVPTALMLVVRRKYPRWWFDWNRELSRFSTRVGAYGALLRDEYPSTDEEQAVHLEIDYPDAQQLNQWLPLVKWLLAVPHYLVLFFLAIAAFFAVIVAWFAILVTGSYPRGLFDFVVGVFRWGHRVSGYAFLLVTDVYPPFSLR